MASSLRASPTLAWTRLKAPEPLTQAVLIQATSTKETSNNDLSDTEHRAAENVLLSHLTEPGEQNKLDKYKRTLLLQ